MYLWQRMWNDANISEMLKWFHIATGKRERPYNRWEPIYIGTNEVQPYHKFKIWRPTLAGDSHAFVWWDPCLAEVLFDTLCQEPTYDERLTWEGRSDKMVQVWTICTRRPKRLPEGDARGQSLGPLTRWSWFEQACKPPSYPSAKQQTTDPVTQQERV